MHSFYIREKRAKAIRLTEYICEAKPTRTEARIATDGFVNRTADEDLDDVVELLQWLLKRAYSRSERDDDGDEEKGDG